MQLDNPLSDNTGPVVEGETTTAKEEVAVPEPDRALIPAWPVSFVVILAATSVIKPESGIMNVVATIGGGAVTLTSNPSIIDGINGQILVLRGSSATDTVTLTDGNGMQLAGNATLGLNDTITLYYDGVVTNDWIEVSRNIAPLSLSSGGTGKSLTASNGAIVYSDADSLELSSVGTSGQALLSGGAGAPTWRNVQKLSLTTTEVTVNNTVANTTIFSATIPGGTLGTNNAIRVRLYCVMSATSGDRATIQIIYGATTIHSNLLPTGNTSNASGFIEFLLMGNGSTSSQKSVWHLYLEENEFSTTTDNHHKQSDDGGASENSSIDKSLEINLAWSGTSSTFSRKSGICEFIT